MADFADAYQSLLRFLYKAPVAAVQARLDGAVEMMTPRAAQILVPMSATGQPDNLFDVLEPYVPELRSMVECATAFNAMVCDGLRIDVRRDAQGDTPQVLTLSLLKMDGRELMAVFADITKDEQRHAAERRETDHKLSELAASLDQALTIMSIALVREDLATGRIFPNERLRAWLGIPEREAAHTMEQILSHVHPDDRAQYVEDHQRAVQGRQASFREFRILRSDGAVAYVAGRRFLERDDQGHPTWLVTFAVDVTDQRLADHERAALADRLKLATEAASIGTFEIVGPAHHVVWNEQTYRLFGHPGVATADPRQVLERSMSPKDLANFDQWVDGVFAGKPGGTIEYLVTRTDGQSRWLASKGRLQSRATGENAALIGVTWDVTEQRLSAEAEQARRVAEQANRAKSEFLSRMSHELRTPLNAILGFSEILLSSREPALTPRQAQQITHVRDSGRHLLGLITDLLDISRIESGSLALHIAEVNLLGALQSALDDTETTAKARGIRILLPLQAASATVHADPVRLRQVLLNLLTNAIKYNRDGGQIELRLAQVEHFWRLSVIDTGIGMSDNQVQRLYRPFDRLGQDLTAIEGTGIGLVITRQLVQAMQGQLSVTSTLGSGTQFDVDLPACLSQAPSRREDAAGVETTKRYGVVGRVLAAEDNPVSAELLRAFVEWRPGVTLQIADTGKACIEAARTFGPELVLLDMMLPDMLGTELLHRLREEVAPRSLPCIFISADAAPGGLVPSPGTRYMTKPMNLQRFLLELDSALGYAEG